MILLKVMPPLTCVRDLHPPAVKQLVKAKGENDKNRLKDGFDDSHGRCVRRRYFGYDVSKLPEIEEWSGAKTVVAVETIWLFDSLRCFYIFTSFISFKKL